MSYLEDVFMGKIVVRSDSQSECPLGLTTPRALRRLEDVPEDKRATNPEHIIMRLWEEENIRHGAVNEGTTPIDHVTHICTEKCGTAADALGNVFPHTYSREIPEDHKRIVAATIQWFGTNQGQVFLGEFNKLCKR
jgi:hypothetical protein